MNSTRWALAIPAFFVMMVFAVLLFEVVGSALVRLLARVKHKNWKVLK